MKKEEFDLVISALQERLDNCEKYLGEIKTTEDLKNITIGQALELRDFCVAEVEKMTKIVMVDLYHIIGMGDLSVPQMMKFVFMMKAYLAYRPNIKSISKGFDSITELPKIPVKTKFKLLALCDLTLTAGEGKEAFEDNATIDEYTELKKVNVKTNEEVSEKTDEEVSVKADEEVGEKTNEEQVVVQSDCFSIVDQTVMVDMGRLGEFHKVLSGLATTPCDFTKLIRRILDHKSYFGIEWFGSENNMAAGKILPSSPLYKLIK